jgi:hypothetical protein
MKNLLFLLVLTTSSFTYSQGVHFAFGTGTSFFKLEAGYSLSDELHFGAYSSPGFSIFDMASSIGGYGRYTFEENDFGGGLIDASFRGYLGANLGMLKLAGSSEYDFWSGQTTVTPSKTTIGFSALAGVEFLYGRKGKFGSFIELHAGKVPNYFNSLSSITGGTTKISSPWGLNAGIRLYFGN